ncbi:hypothetical protein TrVE_jg4972 [Triparma verrucosa]|uniref:Aminotransferase class I/classII large domain-containing protein n=1 Tax=Triparma verrucosa TaxID=1606542 RepID=A0A9W7KW59_9STRA|nr:hypothetical protein TrVE_jg4972 [Triparma verrucosa]
MSIYFYISISTYLLLKQRNFESQFDRSGQDDGGGEEQEGGMSKRGKASQSPILPYISSFLACLENPYGPENQSGLISLCVAENKLLHSMLVERLSKTNPYKTPNIFSYNSMTGLPRLTSSISSLYSRKVLRGTTVEKSDCMITCGAAGGLEHLAFLLAEENDTVLIPSPYYAAFSNDLGVRAKLNLKGIDCGGIIGVDGLEESYDYRVKIVLITNPHNPTGRIYSVEELKEIVEWCRRMKVHLIVDEIYCMSVFKGRNFTSVIDVCDGSLGDYVHVIWAMSKDFGSSGSRIGCIFSANSSLKKSLSNVGVFTSVPNCVQEAYAEILEDEKWVDEYLDESVNQLKEGCEIVEGYLRKLGLEYVEAEGGMFVWANFGCLLPEDSWEGEEAFTVLMFEEGGVVLTPGQSQGASSPGWYRICYAWNPIPVLEVAMERLSYVVEVVRERGWVDLDVEDMDEVTVGGVRRRGSSWIGDS